MGFFDKLKQDITHGGVRLKLEAPASAHETDPSFNATVTVSNEGDAPHTITEVKIALMEDRQQRDTLQMGQTNNSMNPGGMVVELSSISTNEPFTLSPGESKAIPMVIPINGGKLASQNLPEGSGAQQVANVLGKIETLSSALGNNQYQHYVEAKAQVEGIGTHPGARSNIQLFRPGVTGTAFNLHL